MELRLLTWIPVLMLGIPIMITYNLGPEKRRSIRQSGTACGLKLVIQTPHRVTGLTLVEQLPVTVMLLQVAELVWRRAVSWSHLAPETEPRFLLLNKDLNGRTNIPFLVKTNTIFGLFRTRGVPMGFRGARRRARAGGGDGGVDGVADSQIRRRRREGD